VVDADEPQILEALHRLRTAKLHARFRDVPPVDVDAGERPSSLLAGTSARRAGA
jgi:hypothetical protein